MKKNVTLALDEKLLVKTRALALKNKLSFNAFIASLLREKVEPQASNQIEEILTALSKIQGSSKGKRWSRDDIYERK